MTPDERARFGAWLEARGWHWLPGIGIAAFLGLCQFCNIVDTGNSGDEGWDVTALMIGVPIVLNWLVVMAPKANRLLVRFRRRSPHRRDTDLRSVYRSNA